MTTTTIANDIVPATQMRALSVEEIDAVGGGMIGAGIAVGVLVAYLGLHTAVEEFLLDRQVKEYAAR